MNSSSFELLEYNDMKERPEDLVQLVHKYIRVHLIKDCTVEGFIQSVDPISHSIILSVPKNETFQTMLIPGHAVKNIEEITPDNGTILPERKMGHTMAQMNVSELKTRIIAWLKKNLLPVSECEDKIILGNVSVLPPYRTVDICTDNAVVALQIRRIIENMPDNFDPITEGSS